MSRPFQHGPGARLLRLKTRIAEVVAERESIRQAIETGRMSAAEGSHRLVPLDSELAELDSAFKQDREAQQ